MVTDFLDTPSVLDHRLGKDIRQFGIEAFSLEVLEVLEITPEMTPEEIQEDLATLARKAGSCPPVLTTGAAIGYDRGAGRFCRRYQSQNTMG